MCPALVGCSGYRVEGVQREMKNPSDYSGMMGWPVECFEKGIGVGFHSK